MTSVQFIKGVVSADEFPVEHHPIVLVAGRSNCGKSSLLNALVGDKGAARVSKRPGRTAEINFFLIDEKYYLVDLPGYGFAKQTEERKLAWASAIPPLFKDFRTSLLLVLADMRRPIEEEEAQLTELAEAARVPWRLILTKCDKIGNEERMKILARHRENGVLENQVFVTSARTREGIDSVSEAVRRYCKL